MFMPDDQTTQGLGALAGTSLIISLIITVLIIIFAIIIWWKIFSKAGYSGALGLLMFVPIANLIVLLVLAFGQWPIYRELNALRAQVGTQPPFMHNPQYPSGPNYPQNPQYRG
jgi:heme/copper-type cytochrome/quinol oxidase subunit 2